MKSRVRSHKKEENKANASATHIGKKQGAEASYAAPALSLSASPIQQKRNQDLPEALQMKMERSFGQDFSGVSIQRNSSKASELQARAFTQGEHIHFAPGQFNPDTETGKQLIGHEFTHVVQQRSGRVNPTGILKKGVSINDDDDLEREADQLGQKAIRGEEISQYRSLGLGQTSIMGPVQAKRGVIQRAVDTHWGSWDTEKYEKIVPATAAGRRGAEITLKFTPGGNTDAEAIGLTQTARAIKVGTPWFIGDATRESHGIDSSEAIEIDSATKETDEGTHIDRVASRNNPIYGSPSLASGKGLEDTPVDNNSSGDPIAMGVNATYQLGHNYNSGSSSEFQEAKLWDKPTQTSVGKDSKNEFEVTAVALKGNQKGAYYGSVKWGWETDSTGKHELIPLDVVSLGVPSSSFLKAVEGWNSGKDSGGGDTVDLPTMDVHVVSKSSGTAMDTGSTSVALPKGTRLDILDWSHLNSSTTPDPLANKAKVKVVDVADKSADKQLMGKTGWVNYFDLKDER